jgi:hypothetical protein
MGTTLTGTTPATTYDSLIKVTDNGPISGTAKYLSDGLGNDSLLALSTGAVGVGTNTPTHLLQIFAASAPELRLGDATTTIQMYTANSEAVLGAVGSHPFVFRTTATERMRITSTGNVGIGTSAPNFILETAGTTGIGVRSTGVDGVYTDILSSIYSGNANEQNAIQASVSGVASDSGFRFQVSDGSGLTTQTLGYQINKDRHIFYANGSERMRITSDGSVGIGTSSPASPLSVGGTALYDLPASTANFSTADAGKFQLRLTSSAFNVDGNWVGLGMGYSENYMKTAIIARASDGSARGTLNFCINTSAGSNNVTLADTRVTVTSNGLTFNGDTAAANALDDYEEGDWTMSLTFGGTDSNTYIERTGTYTKIGRQVTCNGFLALDTKGSSGDAELTGLPFTIGSGSKYYPAPTIRLNSVSFANQFTAYGLQGSTVIRLEEITEAGVISNLNDTNFNEPSYVMVSITYFV